VIDRKTLKKRFRLDQYPHWPCNACSNGNLQIKEGSFLHEARTSSSAENDPDWEPTSTAYVYSCILKCNNSHCAEVVANTGSGSIGFDIGIADHGEIQELYDYFEPKFFHPALEFIKFPVACPAQVEKSIRDSFALVFSSPSAAANHVRASIESLIAELGVPQFVLTQNGHRKFVNLNQRIEELRTKYPEVEQLLLAIKWLGNAGSHSTDGLTLDDVMDAYEITEQLLHEIYDTKPAKVREIADAVNKRKGPRR
jgi:Domain of unknown function (DUF4145)